eukprot:1114782-Pleurochrysis_carterae.AAC.2
MLQARIWAQRCSGIQNYAVPTSPDHITPGSLRLHGEEAIRKQPGSVVDVVSGAWLSAVAATRADMHFGCLEGATGQSRAEIG